MTIEERQDIENRLLLGLISVDKLPVNLYENWYNELSSEVDNQFDEDSDDYDDYFYYIDSVKTNISKFSSAKVFKFISTLMVLIDLKKQGQISGADYSTQANNLWNMYDSIYLNTEKEDIINTVTNSKTWFEITNFGMSDPMLEYCTQRDDKVRKLHRLYDGIVKRSSDLFWIENYPPNGDNCRCYVKVVKINETNRDIDTSETSAPFKLNSALVGKIWNDSGKNMHNYFEVDKKYYTFRSKNFGLPLK